MYKLQVEGMNCNHCVGTVTRSVKKIDEAAKVDIDLASKKIRVESTADPKTVCAAITEAGYPAREA